MSSSQTPTSQKSSIRVVPLEFLVEKNDSERLNVERMAAWRVNEKPPADYAHLLCEDEEYASGTECIYIEDDESCSRAPTPDAPAFSPYPSPSHCNERSEARDRSRSPLRNPEPSGVVVHIFDENGTALQFDDLEEQDQTMEIAEEVYVTTDTHAVFECPVTDGGDRYLRERGRRGSRGRGRGRGGRERRQYRKRRVWEVGKPLKEIWTTDDDVPAEFGNLVRDAMRSREARVQERDDESGSDNGNESDVDDDEFLDASEDISWQFDWSTMESFQGKEEVFLPKRTGASQVYSSAYDAFRSYWDDGILGLIATETNRYASRIVSRSYQSEWVDTNTHEIMCLFAFWMMLGIIRMPTISSCFSTDPLLKTEVFRRIFIRKRYELLSRALHFIDVEPACSNNRKPDDARTADRLFRLRPILLHLNAKFQSNYILDKEICIDESLTLWKGNLDIKQYIRSRASKFGIKTFELCESVTGYLWSFIVYTGKQASLDLNQALDVPKSTAVVKKLIGPLLHKGYRLFMDNWYNSPLLARYLKRHGTDYVGTLRSSHRDIPVLINKAPLNRGELIARHSGDVSVLAWQDKKRVTMISTCHGSAIALPRVPSRNLFRPVPFKPQVVLDYKKYMGGVDLKDQMLEPYLIERKRCIKWYMKLFKRLLNVSILNSRILLQSSTKKQQGHLAFRLQLVDSILSNHLSHCPLSRRLAASNRTQRQGFGRFMPHSHWPTMLGQVEPSSGGNRSYRRHCVVCLREGRKNIRTTFSCETCKVALCIKGCFKSYHTSSTV